MRMITRQKRCAVRSTVTAYLKGVFMTIEEFNTLTDDDKKGMLALWDQQATDIKNLEAERDSFKTENEDLKKQFSDSETELKATKELNYTLARKLNVEHKTKTVDDCLDDMFFEEG
jgi:chaperonin cofactor prefoldin